jgi:hypothetical protein
MAQLAAVCSPPHAPRACPGRVLTCASRASPTCGGEGLGVGVVVVAIARAPTATPLPNPPPQGGRERTFRVAPLCTNFTGTCSRGGQAARPRTLHCAELQSIRANTCSRAQVDSRRSSSALWSLLRADGASGRSHRRVQCHGGANERLQRLCIDLVALVEIDGAPGVAFEAGVEEA